MSEIRNGYLGYNSENKRYGILNADLWVDDGLHCGECFEVWDNANEKWIPTRIEMSGQEWYLVGTRFKGDDLEHLKVRF